MAIRQKRVILTEVAFNHAGLTDVSDVIELTGVAGDGYGGLVFFELGNDGAALTNFAVLVQPHPSSGYHVYISGAEWAAGATSVLLWSGGALDTLASGSELAALVYFGAGVRYKFQASCAAPTDITIMVNQGS